MIAKTIALFSIAMLGLAACQTATPAADEVPGTSATAWGSGPTVNAVALPHIETDTGFSVLPVELRLSFRHSGLVVVDYTTKDGTAKIDTDYSLAKGRLTFEPGQTSKRIDVWILGDRVKEGEETFTLLYTVVNRPTTEVQEVVLTILDND